MISARAGASVADSTTVMAAKKAGKPSPGFCIIPSMPCMPALAGILYGPKAPEQEWETQLRVRPPLCPHVSAAACAVTICIKPPLADCCLGLACRAASCDYILSYEARRHCHEALSRGRRGTTFEG